MSTFEWAFHYAGPRAPTDDGYCTTCRSKRQGECMAHQKAFTLGCAHCNAAQGGSCAAHCGLEEAIATYGSTLADENKPDFAVATALVLARPAHPTRKNLIVDMRGNDAGENEARELFVRLLYVP